VTQKYVIIQGVESGQSLYSIVVITKCAWRARMELNDWGIPAFFDKVKKDIPEVLSVEFEGRHPESQLLDVTLKGTETTKAVKDGESAVLALANQVTRKLDGIVVSIVDAKR